MTTVLLGLGSNLGDRDANLRRAVDLLTTRGTLRDVRWSAVFTTDPVGGPPQPAFRNAAVLAETDVAPAELLDAAKAAEREVGRVDGGPRWGPREVDVDVLLFGDDIVETADLTVPHPRMAERRFVLEPAADVAPELRHPVLGRTVRELLEALPACA